jgi:hypothetical protein
MKVKFANAEVDVWKLRKGVVLGCGSNYVHLEGIQVYSDTKYGDDVVIAISFADGMQDQYNSQGLEWLEPF